MHPSTIMNNEVNIVTFGNTRLSRLIEIIGFAVLLTLKRSGGSPGTRRINFPFSPVRTGGGGKGETGDFSSPVPFFLRLRASYFFSRDSRVVNINYLNGTPRD